VGVALEGRMRVPPVIPIITYFIQFVKGKDGSKPVNHLIKSSPPSPRLRTDRQLNPL